MGVAEGQNTAIMTVSGATMMTILQVASEATTRPMEAATTPTEVKTMRKEGKTMPMEAEDMATLMKATMTKPRKDATTPTEASMTIEMRMPPPQVQARQF